MGENDFYEELSMFENENYQNWRKVHARAFGDLFENAFAENDEAQMCLTAALNNISKRNFDAAIPTLDMLEKIYSDEADEIAINYFKGLNYEMLGDEEKMTEYYEKLKSASDTPKFNIGLHPYYRTAKFAQRDSECQKSFYYYRKALDFYNDAALSSHSLKIASDIVYQIATLCLYMHEYEECERFLGFSYLYDEEENQQRDYVKAILHAAKGESDECRKMIEGLDSFLKDSCISKTEAIQSGTDPHYCTVLQDRSQYEEFWNSIQRDFQALKSTIMNGKIREAEGLVSQRLTEAMPFMNRKLDCKIEEENGIILVKCKNYYTKSLIAEYDALFSKKPTKLRNVEFVSVCEFGNFREL